MNSNLIINYPNEIILDQIESWPYSIIKLLQSEKSTIESYFATELKIDHEAEENVLLRVIRPLNPFKSDWEYIVSEIEKCINRKNFIGFHCSRLLEQEINDIKNNGLCPLNPLLTMARINNLITMKLLSITDANSIITKNESAANNRKGRIWFFHCLTTLTDKNGLNRIFRSWGGEAIYYHHEQNHAIFDQLKKIGTPCIVVASLSLSDIDSIPSFTERMINIWRASNGYLHDCDTVVYDKQVPIIDVIAMPDPRFEALTGYSRWANPP